MNFNPFLIDMPFRVKQDQCFVVMPFSQPWSTPIWGDIKDTCLTHGVVVVRGDDRLGSNILTDIWASLNESRAIIVDTSGLNPNVMYELGLAHALKKDVILLAQTQEQIPFDLRVFRHILYDTTDDGRAILKQNLSGYLADLFFRGPDNFGRSISDKDFVILFLSTGGTCRCAMANVITRYLLAATKDQMSVEEGGAGLKPMSAALSRAYSPQMSNLARSVVMKRLGIDGSRHQTVNCTRSFFQRANLLLPMAKGLMKSIPEEYHDKTHLFMEYFGRGGDIEDPWGGTEQDYTNCFDQLHSILAANTNQIQALAKEKH